jgi:hypothetical protein
MIGSPVAFINRVVRSHCGHVLLAISWSFILFVFFRRPLDQPQLVDCVPTGDEIYTITEILRVYPIWTVVTIVTHFPAMFVTAGVAKLVQILFSLSCGPTAKVELPLFVLFSSIQWLLVGYIIESFFHSWRART